ncbi:MAG: hypothetical protein ONB51_20335 [candidate division KSB1 bacterium]|nr:hypothetical protein [candidate division KSB1 bacterium]MDZ7411574.1 hypothetical protein [candidate division KSB1 bacterium]
MHDFLGINELFSEHLAADGFRHLSRLLTDQFILQAIRPHDGHGSHQGAQNQDGKHNFGQESLHGCDFLP